MKFVWSSVIASSLVFPVVCHAVGLGPIKVQSGLNQPFNAQIELLTLRGLPLTSVKAKLAGDDEFKLAGLSRPYFLDQLKFSLEKNKLGKPIVHITSDERIHEPYLKFLVDVTWADGQFYREYTVLLDPPNYRVSTSQPLKPEKVAVAPVETPKVEAPRVAMAPLKKNLPILAAAPFSSRLATQILKGQPTIHTPVAVVQPQMPVAQPKHVDTVYGPTTRHDDLYQIALQFRPFAHITVGQTMLAIKKMNPDAFIADNVNSLKAGVELKIPTPDMMTQVTAKQAHNEIHRQNQEWFTPQKSQLAIKKAPALKPIAMVPVVASVAAAEVEKPVRETHKDMFAQLFISPNDMSMPLNLEQSDLLSQPTPETINDANTIEKTLRTELAMTAEAVSAMKQTNLDLREQLVQLQDKNSKLTLAMQAQEKELAHLRRTVAVNTVKTDYISGPAVAPQVYDSGEQYTSTSGLHQPMIWAMLLMILGGGSAGYFFWHRRRAQQPDLWMKHEGDETVASDWNPERYDSQDFNHATDLETLSGEDLISSKLDLATAYISMEDKFAARVLLDEVIAQGSEEQRQEAKKLLKKLV